MMHAHKSVLLALKKIDSAIQFILHKLRASGA